VRLKIAWTNGARVRAPRGCQPGPAITSDLQPVGVKQQQTVGRKCGTEAHPKQVWTRGGGITAIKNQTRPRWLIDDAQQPNTVEEELGANAE